MKFINNHNPKDSSNAAITFMKDIKAAWVPEKYWEVDTTDVYYHDLVWPINEHLDDAYDDPNEVGPDGDTDSSNCNNGNGNGD